MSDVIELAKALNEFQEELVTVSKTADNPFYHSKYADLASIQKVTQPILTKHGLSILQLLDNLDGEPALTTIVMHKSGQQQKGTIPLILAKKDPQGVGSAITYMRRYGYAAALQIVIDEDDDGNATIPAKSTTKKKRFATKKQIELIVNKVKWGTKIYDKDELIGYIDTVAGKPLNELLMTEVDEVLVKLDKAMREDKVLDQVSDATEEEEKSEEAPEVTEQDLANLEAGKLPY